MQKIITEMNQPLVNVTPSAPPSYNEAVVGNFMPATTGLYPIVPAHSLQGSSSCIQPHEIMNPEPTHPPYPLQGPGNIVTMQSPPQPVPIGTWLPVGPQSLKTTCPSCRSTIATRTNTKNRIVKYLSCLVLCATVICIPCACLPFCLCPSTKVEHFCPACNAFLGTYVCH